ncbi:septation protein A [Lutibaculum baratangense]|uniref:Inner membrane-spanning protein YciB n=1 Tax=Lutibaculum baratangense AMV1 TaxID=631454 RepID=V4R2A0_9HYPH|nr:septation protein A [Lutibaculum baratangense]ESR26077.1 putative intracellular septation protein [Lutibaculum baratangense AMV1]
MSETTTTTAAKPQPEWLQPLLEIGPLVIFFIMNWQLGIYWATGGFMAAMVVSVSASLFIMKRLPVMPIFTLVVVLLFGSLTLWLQDETFIKLKPTITNLAFALMLWAGLAFDRPLLKYAFGTVFNLTREGWRILTFRWALFFVFLALVNEVVWRNFSTDTWVAFKVFGIMPITMIFAMAQLPVLNRHALAEDGGERPS